MWPQTHVESPAPTLDSTFWIKKLKETKHASARRIPKHVHMLASDLTQCRHLTTKDSCNFISCELRVVDSSAQNRSIQFHWNPDLKCVWPWYITCSDHKGAQPSHLERPSYIPHKQQARSRMYWIQQGIGTPNVQAPRPVCLRYGPVCTGADRSTCEIIASGWCRR